LHDSVPVATERARCLIIGEKENDVRLLRAVNRTEQEQDDREKIEGAFHSFSSHVEGFSKRTVSRPAPRQATKNETILSTARYEDDC